jgi:hypothetical protein
MVMKIFTFFFLLVLPMILSAQGSPIRHFVDEHSQGEGVDHISLQGNLLQLSHSGEDDVYLKIEKVHFLSTDQAHPIPAGSVSRLIRDLTDFRFEELIQWQEGRDRGRILIREKERLISDVLLLLHGKNEFLLLHLEGQFDFEDLNDLDLDIDGAPHFQRLPERRAQVPRA